MAKVAHEGLVNFNRDVKEERFPAHENCAYKIPEGEVEKIQELLERVSKEADINLNTIVAESETTKLY